MKLIMTYSTVIFLSLISAVKADVDGTYKVRNVTGPCAGVVGSAQLEVFQGKPSKLMFPTATMIFDNVSKIEKKVKYMVLNDAGRLSKVSFQLQSDKSISFKVLEEGDECVGMNINFIQ